jgi:hypothetical protein
MLIRIVRDANQAIPSREALVLNAKIIVKIATTIHRYARNVQLVIFRK